MARRRITPEMPAAVAATRALPIPALSPADQRLVARAMRAMEKAAVYRPEVFISLTTTREYLKLRMAALEREEFHALWLDAQNRLISADCLFVGTLTQTSVYPREVAKAALIHNAAAVILAHNHPSGEVLPSVEDERLTERLKTCLGTVDVKLLDHFIVGGYGRPFSFAEMGKL
jgi:DNA repair protein RadC